MEAFSEGKGALKKLNITVPFECPYHHTTCITFLLTKNVVQSTFGISCPETRHPKKLTENFNNLMTAKLYWFDIAKPKNVLKFHC